MRRSPRLKVLRRFGTALPGLTRKELKTQAAPAGARRSPGGPGGRPRKQKSIFGRRLDEKQKLRYHYGVTETQLRRYFESAQRQRGPTGSQLLSLLERRLDNVVFRLGFAPTIPAARQLVSHGHVLVDDRRVDRPAQLVEKGQQVSMAERAQKIPGVAESVNAGPQVQLPSYLVRDDANPFSGRVAGDPSRDDVPFIVDETAIVEFYAR
jgi:small subunit ribosomal protein S4